MQWESTMYTYGRVRQPPELCHYGIKGQKWGLRRFQLENGSYTPEGKERYRKSGSMSSGGDQSRKRTRHEKAIRDLDEVLDSKDPKVRKAYTDKDRKDLLDYRNKLAAKDNLPLRSKGVPKVADKNDRDSWKAKDAKDLSDEELRRRNNRLQAEQNYKNNVTPQWKKDAKQTAKNWRNEAIKNIFIGTATTLLAAAMVKNYKKVGPIIANASKVAVNKIRLAAKTNSRKTIRNAAERYSSSRSRTSREYDYRLGNRNGIRKSQNWPTIPAKDRKKKG